jgi:plastocyanin
VIDPKEVGMRNSRWSRLAAGVLVAGLVLAACSSDDDGGDETGSGTTDQATGATGDTGGAAGGTTVTIVDFTFDPATIEVSGETTLTITNNDTAAHTFTLDDDSVDEEIPAGESVDVTVNVSETTGFHCTFHPQMTGSIEVA